MNSQPIGIFDSGIGGLSVLKEIRQLMPGEPFIYIADSANAPYGNKSHDFIMQRSCQLTEFLIEQGARTIVVACNTATAVAIKSLRERYPIPFVAMEPGVKPAIAATKSKTIGVLATENTLTSDHFTELVKRFAENVQVVSQPCHGLVEEIEKGDFGSDEIKQLLEQYLSPLLAANADTIVLGCTHYPLVKKTIQQITGEKINIIDTGSAVAQQLQRVLKEQGQLTSAQKPGTISFCSSHDSTPVTLVQQILGCEIYSLLFQDLVKNQA